MLGFGSGRDLPPLCGVTPEEQASARGRGPFRTPRFVAAGIRWLGRLMRAALPEIGPD